METDVNVDEEVLASVRRQVEGEIQEMVLPDPWGYLNNFRCHLFGEEYFPNTIYNYRWAERNWNSVLWNTPHRDNYRKDIEEGRMGGSMEEIEEEHSARWMLETPSQFYANVDRAMEIEGVTPEQIYTLDRAIKQHVVDGNIRGEKEAELVTLIMPVYIRLRAMGYKPYKDLVA